jgi:hypothetical protein
VQALMKPGEGWASVLRVGSEVDANSMSEHRLLRFA